MGKFAAWTASFALLAGLALLGFSLRRGRLFHRDLIAETGAAYNAGHFESVRRRILFPALAGNPRAQYMLGLMFQAGQGTPPDLNRAVKWYARAGSAGYAPAQAALGRIYLASSPGLSVSCLRLAAMQGWTPASYLLGEIYAEGKGVPRDGAEALRWYARAAEQGALSACARVASLRAEGFSIQTSACPSPKRIR